MALETSAWALSTVAGGATLGLVGAGILDRLRDDEASESGGTDPLSDDAGYRGGDDGLSGDGLGGGTDLEAELGGGGGAAGGDGLDGDGLGGGGLGGDGLGGDPEANSGGGGAAGGDDWGDDLDGGGGGVDTLELQRRIEELENDVDSIDATVSTVRSENESIQGTVAEIEEDIRNLLGIYEMVTQGVNPFVDEVDGFNGGGVDAGGDGATLGLFEQSEEDGSQAAEPEDEYGFDEESDDPVDDGPTAEDLNEQAMRNAEDELESDPEPDPEPEPEPAVEPDPTEGRAEPDAEDETKSFSDLKAEYDDEGAETTATPTNAGPVQMSTGSVPAANPEPDPEPEPEPQATDHGASESGPNEPTDDDRRDAGSEPVDRYDRDRSRTDRDGEQRPGASDDAFEYVDDDDLEPGRRDPYLRSLPEGYVGDLLVMEWLEFLVETATVTDAARAIQYYERIDWVSPSVADQLRDFLSGFGQVDRNVVVRPGTEHLDRDHHTTSLRYILQLNEATSRDVLVDRWDDLTDRPLLPTAERTGEHGDGHQDRFDGLGDVAELSDRSADGPAGNGHRPYPPQPQESTDDDRPSRSRGSRERETGDVPRGVDRDVTRPTSRRGPDGD